MSAPARPAEAAPGPGRPRLAAPRRSGATAREQILDAAGELFSTRGYSTTSTREVAEAVGVRQASLYHHFATKDDLLAELLATTVEPSLPRARALVALPASTAVDGADDAARLWALCLFDAGVLCSTRWNLGVLCHLPEVRAERFAAFRDVRQQLRGCYLELGAALAARTGAPPACGDLSFRLVESVHVMRDDDLPVDGAPLAVADAALRLSGWAGDLEPVRAAGRALLAAAA